MSLAYHRVLSTLIITTKQEQNSSENRLRYAITSLFTGFFNKTINSEYEKLFLFTDLYLISQKCFPATARGVPQKSRYQLIFLLSRRYTFENTQVEVTLNDQKKKSSAALLVFLEKLAKLSTERLSEHP